MAWFDVLNMVFEGGVAVDVDDVLIEWRRIGVVNVVSELERGVLGRFGNEFRRF
jgi:hypothetical protein